MNDNTKQSAKTLAETLRATENKPWVDQYLVPMYACQSMIDKANQFDDFQTAWKEWNVGKEMLWLICESNYDRSKLIFCVCDIAEHVLHFYENEYPDDDRPQKAIEAARRVAENDTDENRAAAEVAADASADASSATAGITYLAASVAANAAYVAVLSADTVVHSACDIARDAADTAVLSVTSAVAGLADIVVNAACDAARNVENQWQADCVRRYFPNHPFDKIVTDDDKQSDVCGIVETASEMTDKAESAGETISDDMKMSLEQIQTRKEILVRRIFAVNNILTQDGLDTQTECYLKDVFAAAKTYLLEVDVNGFLEDEQFVDFVKSLLFTCKMIFFEPVTGETRDYAWPEIVAIEHELKYFS